MNIQTKDESKATESRQGQPRPGATAVEFAVVLPILVLLAIACADFARVFRLRQVVGNAVRCGAQVGAGKQFTPLTETRWRQQIEQATRNELRNISGYDPDLASISLSVSSDDETTNVSVQANYPFETLMNWPGISGNVPIEHQVHFRQFR